jgi:hypothetical protein
MAITIKYWQMMTPGYLMLLREDRAKTYNRR